MPGVHCLRPRTPGVALSEAGDRKVLPHSSFEHLYRSDHGVDADTLVIDRPSVVAGAEGDRGYDDVAKADRVVERRTAASQPTTTAIRLRTGNAASSVARATSRRSRRWRSALTASRGRTTVGALLERSAPEPRAGADTIHLPLQACVTARNVTLTIGQIGCVPDVATSSTLRQRHRRDPFRPAGSQRSRHFHAMFRIVLIRWRQQAPYGAAVVCLNRPA